MPENEPTMTSAVSGGHGVGEQFAPHLCLLQQSAADLRPAQERTAAVQALRHLVHRHPRTAHGLILTGEGAPPNLTAFEEMFHLYMPAGQHPLLAWRRLADGYLALRTGAKTDWFYDRRTTEPHVMLRDELTTEPHVMLRDELTTEPSVYPTDPAYRDISLNGRIRDPVLVVVGQNDRLICGGQGADCSTPAALKAAAAPLYGPQARLETLLIPATGHSLNVHRTAPAWYAYAQDWTKRRVYGGR
ncbi:hypothetical protein SGLAM104S_04097 [Streptomyces glaucescens]